MRGDVPPWVGRSWICGMVFPACAGMFRCYTGNFVLDSGFPRVRGDVPLVNSSAAYPRLFSPRARGCSRPVREKPVLPKVFPACAGMFPRLIIPQMILSRFPRVRGDVPAWCGSSVGFGLFSPRARGCSLPKPISTLLPIVFPACAGMFRGWYLPHHPLQGFPRVRGDVPGGHFP